MRDTYTDLLDRFFEHYSPVEAGNAFARLTAFMGNLEPAPVSLVKFIVYELTKTNTPITPEATRDLVVTLMGLTEAQAESAITQGVNLLLHHGLLAMSSEHPRELVVTPVFQQAAQVVVLAAEGLAARRLSNFTNGVRPNSVVQWPEWIHFFFDEVLSGH